MTHVGILGSSGVGQTLALGFKKHGYEVTIGSREGTKLADWSAEHGIPQGTFADVAKNASLLVLAVQGGVAEELVKTLASALAGKTVLDTTNPIGGAPDRGILPFFTGPNDSLMERLQAAAPGAHFVKCFSSVGAARMVDPQFAEGRPTMFICGDDGDAKSTAVKVLDQFGWDAEDIGAANGARAIEPLCILWCAPGFLRNSWTHAFKVLRT